MNSSQSGRIEIHEITGRLIIGSGTFYGQPRHKSHRPWNQVPFFDRIEKSLKICNIGLLLKFDECGETPSVPRNGLCIFITTYRGENGVIS